MGIVFLYGIFKIWNSFLNKTIDIEKDISVSDRNDKKIDSEELQDFSNRENKSIKSCLNKDGKFLITFIIMTIEPGRH